MSKRLILGALGLALVAVLIFALRGNRYGEVSERGYEYATAIYSCCNQKDSERLEKIAELIRNDFENDEISSDESQWLAAIIDQGRQGDWPAAAAEVRQLMMDQIKKS